MKQNWIGVMLLLMCSMVSAQIMIGPEVTGTHAHFTHTYGGEIDTSLSNVFSDGIRSGLNYTGTSAGPFRSYWFTFNRGIMEFDIESTISGGSFPVPGQTSYNWSATLDDLTVSDVTVPGFEIGLDLFDMDDSAQDGVLTSGDRAERQFIERISSTVPAPGETFSIDVTEALRHDLFGSNPSTTSGFILKPTEATWYVRSMVNWMDEPRINVHMPRRTPTPTPTVGPGEPTNTPHPPTATLPPSWTPSPTMTPTATSTPNPGCNSLGVMLWMPSHDYGPGDACACRVEVCNPGPDVYADVPLFVILDVFGEYYFWPDFSAYDYEVIQTLGTQPLIYQVLPLFQWPDGAGTVTSGVRWLAAITNPEMTAVMGDMDTWEFGWH